MSNVDHPSHYNQGGIEPIEFISARRLGFSLGNAVKYLIRAEHKNGQEDYEKALWYISDLLERSKRRGLLQKAADFFQRNLRQKKPSWGEFITGHRIPTGIALVLIRLAAYDLTSDPAHLLQAQFHLKILLSIKYSEN